MIKKRFQFDTLVVNSLIVVDTFSFAKTPYFAIFYYQLLHSIVN